MSNKNFIHLPFVLFTVKKMTGRNQHNGFQFATIVQPPTGGYMSAFGNNSETDYSEEDGETFELRSRGRERHHRSTSTDRKDDIVYLIRDIKEGDTLISISLQYFCTVSQSSLVVFLFQYVYRNTTDITMKSYVHVKYIVV